jgi:hypothetical protein
MNACFIVEQVGTAACSLFDVEMQDRSSDPLSVCVPASYGSQKRDLGRALGCCPVVTKHSSNGLGDCALLAPLKRGEHDTTSSCHAAGGQAPPADAAPWEAEPLRIRTRVTRQLVPPGNHGSAQQQQTECRRKPAA